MTHAKLTRELLRPNGMPESDCDGDTRIVDGFTDTAQPVEGGIGVNVDVYLHRCGKCGDIIVLRQARITNTIPDYSRHPKPFGLLPPEERRRTFEEMEGE